MQVMGDSAHSHPLTDATDSADFLTCSRCALLPTATARGPPLSEARPPAATVTDLQQQQQ
jgi:hypothetical protein